MISSLERISAAFPQFRVSANERPDGDYLISLHSEDGQQIKRVLPYQSLDSIERTDWLIGAIRRDLAVAAGQRPNIKELQSQRGYQLPTYNPL
jgi:hypothetical protein